MTASVHHIKVNYCALLLFIGKVSPKLPAAIKQKPLLSFG